MQKRIDIKKKFINHILKNGKKAIGEKILLNSLKELQKISLKQSEKIFKNAVINSLPIFKINTIKNKKRKKKKKQIKEIPFFIANNRSRVSLSIKLILKSLKKQTHFFKDFNKELLLNNQQEGDSIQLKYELQKKVIILKKFFNTYRWPKKNLNTFNRS